MGDPAPVIIEVLGEPVAAGRPRFTRAGIAYTPAKTRNERQLIRLIAQQQMDGRQPLEGALEVDYIAERTVPSSWSKRRQGLALSGAIRPTTRPDSDNLLKMLDALTHVVWRDDAQICRLTFEKRYSTQPKTIIAVRLLESRHNP